jgi:ATP-dependent DNA helicase RecG
MVGGDAGVTTDWHGAVRVAYRHGGMAEALQLSSPVEVIPGVTQRQAQGLRALGISNLGWLMAHLPLRHERIEAEATIDQLEPESTACARGEVTATRVVRAGRMPRVEAVLHDGTARLDLVWFNQMFVRNIVMPGVRLRVQGKVKQRGPGIQMVNPKIEVLAGEEEPPEHEARMRPVYPATEGFKSWAVERVMRLAVPLGLPLIEDHLPEAFRVERGLPSLREAYRMQHMPADEPELKSSRRRLAYDEFLLLQLGVHLKRAHLRERLRAPKLKWNAGIDAHIRERFPFALTPSQEEVVKEIAKDLSRAVPANRLIQGDVGSGKTVVALYAMLMAVASGAQASLMAPTEILAEQHFLSISRMLQGSRVRVELLTGATPASQEAKASLLERLAAGEIDLLVGTHALLTERVKFKDLAVAIIDEQHRFGVVQRAGLREKASDESSTPHVLVMTATPIPRTMAITLFGDLDVSSIKGLPPGRQPVTTRVVASAGRATVYEELSRRLAKGQQAYVVAPAIDAGSQEELPLGDGEASGEKASVKPLRDVRTVAKELETTYLPGAKVAVLHGQLARATREEVMERFRRREIDVLVATTVIEVGVDVPNATVMVVEQADRFGLAQLHQLRGRVGRGSEASACYLIADPTTEVGQERLTVMEEVADGFALSEKDLELRGPGEMFGMRQSGLPPFKVADLMKDRQLLLVARRDAAAWVKASPRLALPEEALIKRRMLKAYGEHLGLGDVG